MNNSDNKACILSIQIAPVQNNKEKNLLKIQDFFEQNCDRKLDLVVLPEFFSTGMGSETFINGPEDTDGGATIAFLSKLAKKYSTNIVCGTVVEKDGDKLYNTSFILNRRGETIAKYRKIHLYNYFGGNEGKAITPGTDTVVVDFDFAKVGISVCFDIRYPLMFKEMIKKGAEIIVSPSAWSNLAENDDESKAIFIRLWQSMNITRAAENLVCFVSSNLCGKANSFLYSIGNSMITVPSGKILQHAGEEETAIYKDVDLTMIRKLKTEYPIAEID